MNTKALKAFAKKLRKAAGMRLGNELPFWYEKGVAHIEDKLVDTPGYESYDGEIPVNFSASSWDNRPADPDVGYFDAVHHAEGVDYDVNLKKAIIIKYNSPDGPQGQRDPKENTLLGYVKHGEATLVEGEEKQDVIDTFLNMFESEICEYLENQEPDDNYDGPDDDYYID